MGAPVHLVNEEVEALERELQTRDCRADPARLQELLAPDFLEIGASGCRWDRAAVLALLAAEGADDGEIVVHGLRSRVLARDVVQVFWESARGERRARRTSLWCRRDGRWQQTYHQGTPMA